jgi:hypothetical protein
MSISNFLENELLDTALATGAYSTANVYVSVHTADPGETGASEVTGGGYGRQGPTTFSAAASGTTSNTAQIDFTNIPAVTATHIGLWDAATAGNFLWGGALTSSKTLNGGDTFRIAATDLDVSLD